MLTQNDSLQILSKYGRTPAMIFEILRDCLDFNLKHQNEIFDGRVWACMTMSDLARKTQRSVPSVNNHIRRLRNDGIILVEHYGRVKGRNTNYYTLDLPKYQNLNVEEAVHAWTGSQVEEAVHAWTESQACGLSFNDLIDNLANGVID